MNMFGKSQALAIAVGILVIGTGPVFSEPLDPTGYIDWSKNNDSAAKTFSIIKGIDGYDLKTDPTGYVTLSRLGSVPSYDPTGYLDMARIHDPVGMSFAVMLGTPEIEWYDARIDPTGYLTMAASR